MPRSVVKLCAALVIALVFVRNLPFLGLPLPASLTPALMWMMSYETAGWVIQFLLIPVHFVLALTLLLILLFRWRWVLEIGDGTPGVGFRPWLLVLLWLVLLLNNFFLDLNPRIALAGALALLVAAIPGWLGLARPRLLGGAAAAVVLLGGAIAGSTRIDAAALLIFGLLLVPTLAFLRSAERPLVGLYLLIATQFAAPLVALRVEAHPGTRLGGGEVYGFCESVAHDKLWAVVQACMLGDKCQDGHLIEHARSDLATSRRLDFFGEAFEGRLQQCVAFEDVVQIGMNETRVGRVQHAENVMEFDIEDPSRFNPRLFDGRAGYRLAWDRARDAIYYVSEWQPAIYRMDRKTGELDRKLGYRIAREIGRIEGLKRRYSLSQSSLHPGRDELVFGGMGGSRLEVMDLEAQRFVRTIPLLDGLFLFPMVDEARSRVWVAGNWGITVVDLETGKTLSRTRAGTFNRLPTLDEETGLVFVTSTFDGRLHVFDRDSMDHLGALYVGLGLRVPMVSKGTGRLFVPAAGAYFVFDTHAMAARFRGS